MTQESSLQDRLNNWLSKPKQESDQGGSWVKPTPEDFQEFYDLCVAIRDARWGRDGDGDPTIEIRLTDRSIGRHPWVPLVLYHHYPDPITDANWQSALSLLDVAGDLHREARNLINAHREALKRNDRSARHANDPHRDDSPASRS
jgi:hypothetical protein